MLAFKQLRHFLTIPVALFVKMKLYDWNLELHQRVNLMLDVTNFMALIIPSAILLSYMLCVCYTKERPKCVITSLY